MYLLNILLIISASLLSANALIEYGEKQAGTVLLVQRARPIRDTTNVTFNTDNKYGITIDKVVVSLVGQPSTAVTELKGGPTNAYVILNVSGVEGTTWVAVKIYGRWVRERNSIIEKSDIVFSENESSRLFSV